MEFTQVLATLESAFRSCSKSPISIERGDGTEAIPHRPYRRAMEARRTFFTRRQARRTPSRNRPARSPQRAVLPRPQWMPMAHDPPRVSYLEDLLQLLPRLDRERYLG